MHQRNELSLRGQDTGRCVECTTRGVGFVAVPLCEWDMCLSCCMKKHAYLTETKGGTWRHERPSMAPIPDKRPTLAISAVPTTGSVTLVSEPDWPLEQKVDHYTGNYGF
jgi:hypothetical protein